MAMKRALRDKWAAALEGGKYEQGKGCLRSPLDKCCCIGVLADVYNPKLWVKPNFPPYNWPFGTPGTDGMASSGNLSDTLLWKIGLTAEEQDKFVNLNDNKHKSFKQIAKVVRKLPVED